MTKFPFSSKVALATENGLLSCSHILDVRTVEVKIKVLSHFQSPLENFPSFCNMETFHIKMDWSDSTHQGIFLPISRDVRTLCFSRGADKGKKEGRREKRSLKYKSKFEIFTKNPFFQNSMRNIYPPQCGQGTLPVTVDVSIQMLNPVLPREVTICRHATITNMQPHKLSEWSSTISMCHQYQAPG